MLLVFWAIFEYYGYNGFVFLGVPSEERYTRYPPGLSNPA